MFKKLTDFICDKYYYVETQNHGAYKGYMLNYNSGNIVMLTLNGVVHMPYREIDVIKPVVPTDDLVRMVKNIKGEQYGD